MPKFETRPGQSNGNRGAYPGGLNQSNTLTKREVMAIAALQALLSQGIYVGLDIQHRAIAQDAIAFADALLEELEKPRVGHTGVGWLEGCSYPGGAADGDDEMDIYRVSINRVSTFSGNTYGATVLVRAASLSVAANKGLAWMKRKDASDYKRHKVASVELLGALDVE